MEIYEPGTVVSLGNQKALVIEVLIKAYCSKEYKVVWWDGSKREIQWVSEIEIVQKPETSISFHQSGRTSG